MRAASLSISISLGLYTLPKLIMISTAFTISALGMSLFISHLWGEEKMNIREFQVTHSTCTHSKINFL